MYAGLDEIRNRLVTRLEQALQTHTGYRYYHGCEYEFIDFLAILKKVGMRPRFFAPYWTLDHVIPLTYFDLFEEEQVALSHIPANLEWIPHWTNQQKSCAFPEPIPQELQPMFEIVKKNFTNHRFLTNFVRRSKGNQMLRDEAMKHGLLDYASLNGYL